jgi:succinate dehydrogenase / fumarate reductase membrane anchor subunit
VKGPLTGLRAWLVQRLTAVYLLGFTLFLLAHLSRGAPVFFEAWRSWVLSPGIRVAWVLFFVALLLHAWVGMRDVILDYVHPLAVRLALLAVVAAGLLATGVWMVEILLVSL